MEFGIFCLVPAIVILAFALITKRTFEALFIGSMVGLIMYYKQDFFGPLVTMVQTVIADEVWIFVAFALFGFFVVLLEQSKGTIGFANLLVKWANSQKKTMIASWILGIVVFLDDFLNILTVSSAMRELSDRHKTPREFFAYLLDSTGAPVCVLIPLSTWAIFYADLAQTEFSAAGVTAYGDGMSAYISSIPFMFYSWIAVILVPLTAVGLFPKLGLMKKAFDRVEENGRLWSEASDKYNVAAAVQQEVENSDVTPKARNFIVPLVVVIVAMLITEDMVSSLLIVFAVMFIMYIPTKTITFEQFCEALPKGVSTMLPVMIILVGCYMVRDTMNLIEMPQYVVNAVVPYCSAPLLPAITFVVVALLAFVTGSSWGVPAIAVPILMPIAFASGANPLMVLGALVAGASFGSHACFYADATVLASQASKINNLDHALSQIPYALTGAIIAVILYLIGGFVF